MPRVGARNGNADVKVSDHTMTILTGLVLTLTVGMLAQNSEAVMASLSGENVLKVEDDAYTVRAGKPQLLDVLLNDSVRAGSAEYAIVIMDKPHCGDVALKQDKIEFSNSDTCNGNISFSYCLTADENCETASVSLQVLPHGSNGPVVASASEAEAASSPVFIQTLGNTEIASVPTLLQPDAVEDVGPQVATDQVLALNTEIETPDVGTPPVDSLVEAPVVALVSGINGIGVDRPAATIVATLPPSLPTQNVPSVTLGPVVVANNNASDDTIAAAVVSGIPTADTVVAAAPSFTDQHVLPAQLTIALAEVSSPLAKPLSQPVRSCSVELTASAAPGGEISLSLSAPCMPDSAMTIRQGAFEFTATTDSSGEYSDTIPAFAQNAVLTALLADGITKSVDVFVPDADRFTRVALLWSGDVDLDLHAAEYGARLGQPGYVWSGEPASYRQSHKKGGGYLQTYGAGGSFAEIYTLPVSKRQVSGVVDLSLHVAGGSTACDQNVDLRILRFEGGSSDASNVRFTLGSCGDNMSGYEVINALSDLRVAAR